MDKTDGRRVEFAKMILGRFEPGFAVRTAAEIAGDEMAVEYVYELATGNHDLLLSIREREQIVFRCAYLLETLYFDYPVNFQPYRDRFFEDFPRTTNGSARRHFTKMMEDLLKHGMPSSAQCEEIAGACVQWAIEDRIKVTVRIWAVEVLFCLRNRVDWLEDVIPEVLELLARNPSSGMNVCLRRWRIKFIK